MSIATCAVHPLVTGGSAVTTLACCVTGSDPWAEAGFLPAARSDRRRALREDSCRVGVPLCACGATTSGASLRKPLPARFELSVIAGVTSRSVTHGAEIP